MSMTQKAVRASDHMEGKAIQKVGPGRDPDRGYTANQVRRKNGNGGGEGSRHQTGAGNMSLN